MTSFIKCRCVYLCRSTSMSATSEMGEEALSNSLFHSDNFKSFPFTRMEMYEKPYTESCVSTIASPLFVRRSRHAKHALGSVLSCWVCPERINHRASTVSPFPKAGACLGPIARSVLKPWQRLLQHYKLAQLTGVHHTTAVLLNASVEQYYGKLFSSAKPLLHFFMSKKSSGKLK